MFYNYVLIIFLIVIALYSATHALIYKKDSRAAFGWIAVCVYLPFFGPLLYFIFGINRIQKRAHELSASQPNENIREINNSLNYKFANLIPESLKNLHRVSSRITNMPLMGGNKVESLFSGEQTYTEMLKEINNAEKYIYLCVYIFKPDIVGKKFIQSLIEAQNRDVKVYVLIDGIGELYSWGKVRKKLVKHDIFVKRFLPPKLIPLNLSINLRNHRKLLVIDDRVCFIGGMNISSEYSQHNRKEKFTFKDIHFKLSGPITTQLKEVFESDWRFMSGTFHAHETTTVHHSTLPTLCRTITDGPGENLDHLSIILRSAINSASNNVTLMTPYFLPSRELIAALITASLRDVNVIIILPEKNNLNYVHWATRHMLWELLEHGIKIYYQPPPFSHSKLFFIDNQYSLIGSANIDPRSLRLNYEVGVEIYDVEVLEVLNNYVQNILQHCREVTLDEVDNRPLYVKIRDGIAWLFSPYL